MESSERAEAVLDDRLMPLVEQMFHEWCRLNGYSMKDRSPIEEMVDQATGCEDARMREFAAFFVDVLRRLA